MRYILTVTAIVHDPTGEPVRLGSTRYYVEHAEVSNGTWPIVGAREMTPNSPMTWYLPTVDGKPSGAIFIECALEQAPEREADGARMSRPGRG